MALSTFLIDIFYHTLYNTSVIMMAKFAYFLLLILLQSIIDTVVAATVTAMSSRLRIQIIAVIAGMPFGKQ